MRKYLTVLSITLVLSFGLTGCASLSKRDTGTIAGGVLGGAAGSVLTGGNAIGTVGGAVGGAYLGNRLAR